MTQQQIVEVYVIVFVTVFAVMFGLILTTSQAQFHAFSQLKRFGWWRFTWSVAIIILAPSFFFASALLAIPRLVPASGCAPFVLTIVLLLWWTTPVYACQQLWLMLAVWKHWGICRQAVGSGDDQWWRLPFCWVAGCGFLPLGFLLAILGQLFSAGLLRLCV
ncbi:MAG: hypothetical protein HYX92_07740 [Chloroflexi bacterium]|nr:hypothetical protein [Chloroflexota bacterium]